MEAGKRIIEIDKLKTSLEENRKEIKDLTDRHVALDRIKQIISDTKSLALEETVETLNALLDEISRVMYGNETRIVVSMFKELKSRDYLKAELNVQLITGYGEEAIDYDVDELSGGQQQRVAIARALITRPELVLADEPTANLDSKTSEQIIALMQQLNQQMGVTFLFSTHDPRVMQHAKRVIYIADGKIVDRNPMTAA